MRRARAKAEHGPRSRRLGDCSRRLLVWKRGNSTSQRPALHGPWGACMPMVRPCARSRGLWPDPPPLVWRTGKPAVWAGRGIRLPGFKEREAGIEVRVASVPFFLPKAPRRIRGREMTGSASIRGNCSPDPTRFLESVGSSGGPVPQKSGHRPGQPVDVGSGPVMSTSPTGYHEKHVQRVLPPPPGFQPSPPAPRRFPADRSRWQDLPPPVRQGHGRCSGPWLEGRARGDVEGRVGPHCLGPRTRP